MDCILDRYCFDSAITLEVYCGDRLQPLGELKFLPQGLDKFHIIFIIV
ncbi:hypothetical protein [Calothrix sp. NIES-2098]|nr:hypothetical protein NIES2098_31730 [Calothrix sp. NIES-2098]